MRKALFILALFIVGAGLYFAAKNQLTLTFDPTANWLTYIDSDQGFSFKYPANWSVSKKTDNDRKLTMFKGPNNFVLWYDTYSPSNPIPKCAVCSRTIIDTLNTGRKNLYLVIDSMNLIYQGGQGQTLSLTQWKTYDEQKYKFWPYFDSIKDGSVVRFSGEYEDPICNGGCKIIPIEYSDFINREETKTAIQILSSFKFTE